MIKYWNPYTKREEVESVYGSEGIKFLYETKVGQKLSEVLSQPLFSKIYGVYQSSFISKNKIPGFIKHFNIQMDEYEKGPFKSFNDFFIRKFLPSKRVFCGEPKDFPAFAEGRYLAFGKMTANTEFPVKGKYLSAENLLHSEEKARPFIGGPLIIARLCPVDYHRFHFPDNGEIVEKWHVDGRLQSVNPAALNFKNDIFITNERQVTILKTKNFGRLAYIEVGAMLVGKIVQSYPGILFKRGDEKGYFLFGASTVIVMGEPGSFSPASDLIDRSTRGLETFFKLGDKITR